ncbi:MAG: hypothetical protein ACXV3S_03930 [Kineosporiaceae bacterium]
MTTPLTGPRRAPGGGAGPAPPGRRAPGDVRTGDRRQQRPRPRTAGRRRAALLVGLTLLAPVLAAFVLRRDAWVVTSDSVAQQSIVRTWFAAGHDVTYLPPDTWLLKVPLYVVVEALPLAPTTRLLVESAVLAAVAVVAAAWATWELAGQAGLRRSRSLLGVLLPFAWFGTLSGGTGSYLVSLPNSRNVELGLALVVVAVAGRRLAGHRTWRRPSASSIARAGGTAVVAAVLLAILWVDDPYVAYLVGIPLALAAAAWFARPPTRGGRDPRLLGISGTLLASLGLASLIRTLMPLAGIRLVVDGTAPTLDPAELIRHMTILPNAAAGQLGLAEPGGAAQVVHVLAVALLALAVVSAGAVAVRGWRGGRLAVAFLGVHWLVVAVGVVANRTIYDFHAGRYLVLALVDLAACLGIGIAMLRERLPARAPRLDAIATGLVALAVTANLVSAAADHPIRPAQIAEARQEQQAVLAVLTAEASRGATKGFGPFWTADLYTHLSGGRVQLSDVVCDRGGLRARGWLTDTARLRMPAARTVVVLPPAAAELQGCTPDGIVARLGRAAARIVTPGGTTVLVFDRDVTLSIGDSIGRSIGHSARLSIGR